MIATLRYEMKAKNATWTSIAYLNHCERYSFIQFSEPNVEEKIHGGVVEWIVRRRSRLREKGQPFLISHQYSSFGAFYIGLVDHGVLVSVFKLRGSSLNKTIAGLAGEKLSVIMGPWSSHRLPRRYWLRSEI